MTYDEVLVDHGWYETGGGNNFTSYESKLEQNPIYVFELDGRGTNDSHWLQLYHTDEDRVLAGGFSVESLHSFLSSFGYFNKTEKPLDSQNLSILSTSKV